MTKMTRMDRHKKSEEIDRSPQEQSSNLNKEVNKHNVLKQNPKKKKKRKKGKGCLFFIFILLLISVLFSVGMYAKGYFSAKNDTVHYPTEVTDFKGQKASDGSVNILLLGSDSRGEDQGRSDSLLVFHYNKRDKQPKLISIMRDTFVPIPTKDGVEYNKINAAYSYGGPELVRQTITNTFGIPIQYFAVVNFDSFPKIIETLAPHGLKINAEKDLEVEGTIIKKGPQQMNGLEVLQYSRFRKDAEGDFGRVRRQQQVLEALVKQGLSPLNAWRLPEVVGKVQGYTETDIPFNLYLSLGTSYLFSRHKPLDILTVPVANSWNDGYYDYAGSVLEIDEATNKEAVSAFLNK
ncbi:LCP family protein [Vagococcus penaei]|uniref:LCP family protein n=1 Tax=Vagococcus penaei TaxID=633807 RepID=UPI001E389986|nr:LCP family protein [Vagococcus penaei]